MGKLDMDNSFDEEEALMDGDTSLENENEDENEGMDLGKKGLNAKKDMRRLLEDRLIDVRLDREMREYDFKDI